MTGQLSTHVQMLLILLQTSVKRAGQFVVCPSQAPLRATIDGFLSKESQKCYNISSCDSVVVRVKFTFAKESKEESG